MNMHIIPEVQNYIMLDGEYVFSDEYSFKTQSFPFAYKYLQTFLNLSENGEEIKCIIDNSLKREEYILLIDGEISITARDEEGIFRAISTLKQLSSMGKVNNQKIHDYPVIKNRGLLLDISRGRIPKIENIKKIIKILRDLKYNQLQLYMDGLVFEYAHFKKYLEEKDVISIEELKGIKDYCKENFIELTPTQNGFGHMEKWLELPELQELAIKREDGGKNDTLNPFDERSLELVDTIYSDLLPYFNSGYINVGMDEPHSLGMGQTKEVCEKDGKDSVYIDYLNKIIKLANEKYNKIPMVFDDIIFENPESIGKIKGECVVMDWGYEAETPFIPRCELISRMGLKFYTCPGTSSWSSYTGRFDNMVYNIENAAKACIHYKGEGMLLTDWGDGGHPQGIAMSFIPYAFAACCAWNYRSSIYDFSYWKKVDIIKYIEEYVDKFIFGQKGVGSILHRMANYYLLENQNRFNETYIKADTKAYSSGNPAKSGWLKPMLTQKDTIKIENYMYDLKCELNEFNESIPYIEDIKLNCDMVILFARFIRGNLKKDSEKICDSKLKQDLLELRRKFKELWFLNNKKTGYEIFEERLNQSINLIE